ncbi:hypothetical protein JAO29_20545 [Edaphobacter sp. HDX4]
MSTRTVKPILFRFARTISLFAVLVYAAPMLAQVKYVDPTIGNVGILLVPTRPTVYLPNSMVSMYPVRVDALDDRIQSFPLTISSHRISELFSIMPGDGEPAAYEQEMTTPYFYSTTFRGSGGCHRVYGHRALWLTVEGDTEAQRTNFRSL